MTFAAESISRRPAGYRDAFAVREFRAVFAAHLLSLLGLVTGEIALSVLVYRVTGSPLLSALAFALGFLPYLVGGTLLAGVADRAPARRVLVAGNLLCAASAAVTALPGAPVAVLLAMRGFSALIGPVLAGTRSATLGDVLGEGDLFVLGRSLIRIVTQGAQLAGFAAGGLLLTAVSPRTALLFTVAGFLASALLLRFGTRRRPGRAAGAAGGAGGADVIGASLSGARQLLADRRTRALLLLSWAPPFFLVAPESLAAPYADAIGAGTVGVGLLMCGMPVGTIVGEVLAGSLLSPRARERITLPAASALLLPFLLYVLGPPLGWALATVALAGLGAAYTLGLDQWFVAAVPEELRGRAMTLQTAGAMTVQGMGMALAGAAAEYVPAHWAVAGSGVIGTLVVGGVVRLVVGSR
ncbi:MFS transporter [Streptomyces klenkii]|uniref:MFS transporter n=1 Tax=Streptomyces klenkii TaxID=1420899 RepID=UPI00339EBC8A